jgi:hypothetical protein
MSDETHRHLFKLVSVSGTSERWRCIGCNEERIDGPQSKCPRCGGYRHEPRPWWCGNMTGHATQGGSDEAQG